MTWPAAVTPAPSSPDAVAAIAIARRLPARGATVVLEESLVNDLSALILYRAAVAAAVTGVNGRVIVRFFDASVASRSACSSHDVVRLIRCRGRDGGDRRHAHGAICCGSSPRRCTFPCWRMWPAALIAPDFSSAGRCFRGSKTGRFGISSFCPHPAIFLLGAQFRSCCRRATRHGGCAPGRRSNWRGRNRRAARGYRSRRIPRLRAFE
jgi:hypothetical protein